MLFQSANRSAFTLIELLVVIAIIAILSVVVILTLNPASLLQQSRDATRVSDMSTLNSAISVYLSAGGTSMGNSNTVYVSIPDPTATSTLGDQCQGLGLPSLPSPYSYHCAASSTVRNTDATGWIPINFASIAIGSSLSQLPLDPINQSSTRLYYTYTTNGTQFEVTSNMESSKYQVGGSNDVISSDGGTLASVYEKGSKLGLEPLDYGDPSLVGFWPLTEGTGTIAYDDSGNNATGTWNGTATGTSGYYSPGKGGGYPWAGAFDGSSTYVSIPANTVLNIPGPLTEVAWVLPTANEPSYGGIAVHRTGGTQEDYAMVVRGSTLSDGFNYANSTWFDSGGGTASLNAWHQYAITRNSGGSIISCYIDGNLVCALSGIGNAGSYNYPLVLGADLGQTQYFKGSINDVRIYNRALSATQIAAMYAAGK